MRRRKELMTPIPVRFSPSQRVLIDKAADQLGLDTSSMLRLLVTNHIATYLPIGDLGGNAVFDLVLAGFDADTDETDHLVKWIAAPDRPSVVRFAQRIGLKDYAIESSMLPMIGFEDGLDVLLDGDGAVLQKHPDVDVTAWKDLV